jgi:DNA-binding MarR family transcriptional regulator
MSSYDLLQKLLQKVQAFEQEHNHSSEVDLEHFAVWLFKRIHQNKNEVFESKPCFKQIDFNDQKILQSNINQNLTRQIAMLYRYARFYYKYALEGSDLQNVDEMIYLIVLQSKGTISKSEAIHSAVQEKTTGTEILKKLIQKGFIQESSHPDDRRSKLVSITNQGSLVLWDAFQRTQSVSEIVMHNIEDESKIILQQCFNRLEIFHDEIHRNGMHQAVLEAKQSGTDLL